MSLERELTAAGIEDLLLRQGYRRARQLNAEHGKTYYLAALLLPAAKRPYVHALYGFARYADDIVDDLDPTLPAQQRAIEFDHWCQAFLAALDSGRSSDPMLAAVLDTIARWQLPRRHFTDFLESMAMDLTVTEYESYPDLERYVWGSAAVIGLQMLPILGFDRQQAAAAEESAAALGIAFQLTNFLRDVGEDLDRGRIYLPQQSLRAAGVDRDRLVRARELGRADRPIRELVRFEIERARACYRLAEPGIELLDRSSRPCMRTASRLYGGILDEIVRADYDVFARRATVPVPRRLRVAVAEQLRARLPRTGKPKGQVLPA